MARLTLERVSDVVARELESRILDGALKTGDRLPPERELAATLGVSRPSLREAIQKLVSKGLLHSRQGGGTYVTDRLEASFYNPWEQMLSEHPNLREDLLEFRHMLEGQAAYWAAERATEADLARLEDAFNTLNDAFADNEDLEQRSDKDIAFHQVIAESAHNAMIAHLMATMLRLMHEHIRLNLSELATLPKASELIAAQHRALYQAIVERRPEAARAAAETHIDFVQETLAQTLRSVARRESAERRLRSQSATH